MKIMKTALKIGFVLMFSYAVSYGINYLIFMMRPFYSLEYRCLVDYGGVDCLPVCPGRPKAETMKPTALESKSPELIGGFVVRWGYFSGKPCALSLISPPSGVTR